MNKETTLTAGSIALAVLLALAPASTCLAGSKSDSGSAYFDVVDTDHDNRITLPEYLDRFTWAFHKMDTNHDKVISPNEQLVPNGRKITLEDLKRRLEEQFKRQDKNENGWLNAREFLAPPA